MELVDFFTFIKYNCTTHIPPITGLWPVSVYLHAMSVARDNSRFIHLRQKLSVLFRADLLLPSGMLYRACYAMLTVSCFPCHACIAIPTGCLSKLERVSLLIHYTLLLKQKCFTSKYMAAQSVPTVSKAAPLVVSAELGTWTDARNVWRGRVSTVLYGGSNSSCVCRKSLIGVVSMLTVLHDK